MRHEHKWLTDEEVHNLIRALARGSETFSKEDACRVIEWASMLRIGGAMLALALEGKLTLQVNEHGEVSAQTPKNRPRSPLCP